MQPFKNVPFMIAAIVQPKPAKVIRLIRIEEVGSSVSIRLPIVQVPSDVRRPVAQTSTPSSLRLAK